MFEIKVADGDVTSGSVPVSWCVDVETIKYLADNKIVDPQVVIVVAPDMENYSSRKEVRRVVPLQDLMAYVEFRVPGKNKIWAFLSKREGKEARERYLYKSGGDYGTDILKGDGSEWSYIFEYDEKTGTHQPAFAATPLTVSVPKACFAREPSLWEKSWVNHFFKSKCEDQCDFRRRRMFAYLLQPFLMLGQIVLRALFLLVALLIGAKNMSASPLFHPMRMSFSDAFEVMTGGSYFIRNLPEDDKTTPPDSARGIVSYFVRKLCLLPFMPIVLIPIVTLLLVHKVQLVGVIAIAIVFALIFLGLVLFVVGGGAKNLWKFFCKMWQGAPDEEELWYMDQEEIGLLTCNANTKPLSFKTLPARKQTLRLRFLNLKSKVCRPFSA